jgi:Fe-S-cluster containining protein
LDTLKHPGAVATWLAKTWVAMDAYMRHQPFALDVPCGSCTACCTGYEIELRASDDQGLTSVPGEMYKRALPRTPAGDCVHLVQGKCSIYARRPASCREYDCRRMFFCALRGERADINAAIEQWDPARIYKTLEDRIAHHAISEVRDEAVALDQARTGGRYTCEVTAINCVLLAKDYLIKQKLVT